MLFPNHDITTGNAWSPRAVHYEGGTIGTIRPDKLTCIAMMPNFFYKNHVVLDNHHHTIQQPFYTQVSRCQKRTSGLYGAKED